MGFTSSGGPSWLNWSQLNGYWKPGDPTSAYNTGAKDMTVFAHGQGTPAQLGDTQNINNGEKPRALGGQRLRAAQTSFSVP